MNITHYFIPIKFSKAIHLYKKINFILNSMQIPPYSSNCYFNPLEKKLHYVPTSTVPWYIQVGCFYDICFRLADSIPPAAIRRMTLKADLLQTQQQSTDAFYIVDRYLTCLEVWARRGIGECLLNRPGVREILTEEILRHDEVECQIGAFVIMGNHVHLILKMLGIYSPYELVTRIKKYSALRINRLLDRSGKLWMQGEYNHIIRSPKELVERLNYLKGNPSGMNIPVYVRPDEREFMPYTTPFEEMAPLEQQAYYGSLGW